MAIEESLSMSFKVVSKCVMKTNLLSRVAKLSVKACQRPIVSGTSSLNLAHKYPLVSNFNRRFGNLSFSSKNDPYNSDMNACIRKEPVNKHKYETCRESFYEYIKLIKELKKRRSLLEVACALFEPEHCEAIVPFKNQIFRLSLLLQCSRKEAIWVILKHRFLLQSKVSTLKPKVDLITGSGIGFEDLRRDLWVLTNTLTTLELRINQVKSANLPIKVWMLRCPEYVLKRTLENHEQNQTALFPYSTLDELLCCRLKLDINQLTIFSKKHPSIMKVNGSKIKQILDYLLCEGFTPDQIYVTPRILCHSLTTIKSRLDLLRSKDHDPCSLSLLCMSKSKFETHLRKLEKKMKA